MASPKPRPPQRHQQRFRMRYAFPQEVARAATGLITCVSNANMVDGDFVTIGDGIQAAQVYEYDKSSNGVTAGRNTWAAGAATAADCAATLRTAILAKQPSLNVIDNADGTLTIRHRIPGEHGNVPMTENVANAGFLVSGMTGGAKGHAITADTTIRLGKSSSGGRTRKVDRVSILLPDGLAADAANYCNFKLIKGANTVIANWSTQTGQNGGLTADTAAEMTLSATQANLHIPDATVLSLFIDVTGSPYVLPGFIEIEGIEL